MKKPLSLFRCCAALFLSLALCFALSACGSKSEPQPGDSPAATTTSVAQSGSALSLAHGVRAVLPKGWVVRSSLEEGAKTTAEIEQTLKSGKPVQLLLAHRVDATGQNATGMIALAIVDATKTFIPQQDAATLPPQEFAKYASAVLERERQLAAQSKTESSTTEYALERQTINGKLAVIHKILGKRPGGVMRAYEMNMYLPSGKGLIARCMGFQEYPNNDAELMNFIRSISVNL